MKKTPPSRIDQNGNWDYDPEFFATYVWNVRSKKPLTAREHLYLFWYYTDTSEASKKDVKHWYKIWCGSRTTAWRTHKSLEKKGVL